MERNVLMIGNSFSVSVMKDLPAVAASMPDCRLRIMSLYIGGCPLSLHASNIRESEADPAKKQYDMTRSGFADDRGGPASIPEALQAAPWDIVTIQQASHESWDYASYQPHAEAVISTIRRLAPQAEILIQHTWSYNADDARLQPGSAWGFDQTGMHRRVTDAYNRLASEYGFRKIPTGPAVAAARRAGLPDVVGCGGDTIHLNRRGEYLQACVWFATIFDRPAREISYVSPDVTPEEAIVLRSCADDARTSDFR